ncbi:MAG: PrgI family protein [Candidatus Moranbacteria bacterium]|nr:PrgI family protein [Candidatus Moranbacteria bacterium]
MIFNVPQFIDIEDKLVGPLTAKQLGWLALGAVVLLILYGLLDKSAFLLSAIIVATISGAFAFYKPYNQPLIKFITSSILFVTRPKMYIWRRVPEKIQKASAKKDTDTKKTTRKTFDAQKIADISQLLDMRNNQNH